jgi:hypothetical protein
MIRIPLPNYYWSVIARGEITKSVNHAARQKTEPEQRAGADLPANNEFATGRVKRGRCPHKDAHRLIPMADRQPTKNGNAERIKMMS